MIRDQRGFLSADFLFSMVIAAVVCMLLFAMATTYTVIEVSQYIAFSAGRAHASARQDYAEQQDAARSKYNSLVNNSVFAPLFRNGWFDIKLDAVKSGETADGNFSDEYPTPAGGNAIPVVGVRLELNAKLLNMRVGPLGSSDGSGQGFKTKVTGFVSREPTWEECWEQMKSSSRYESILNLDSRYKIAAPVKTKYTALEDNGC